jgi:biofilm PGA synthesis N-glycosyltransferase PgaC
LFVYALFWFCLACLFYTYVGYPLLLAAWAKLRGRPVRKGAFDSSFTIVLAARNEEKNIGRRLTELRHLIGHRAGDIIVCADGCTDRTAEIASEIAERPGPPVQVLSWVENRGKAAALSAAAAVAVGEVLIFADARQTWAADTIANLLANFADADVGAVSGDLQLETAPGVLAGVGLYWRFEKWLRMKESLVHAQVGVTGAVCAVRRGLFTPIPPGTLLDDVYWPLRVAMSGKRVVHDNSARAHDRLPETSQAEFWRKVRTLAGNYQLARLVPASLLPWRNPVWMAWVSHKLMRLVSPWALIGLIVTPIVSGNPALLMFLSFEALCYVMALAGLTKVLGQSRLLGAAASFLILNAAAWVAFWVWLFGRTGSAWRKTEYRSAIGSEAISKVVSSEIVY